MTANEEVRDALIRHQVGLIRLSGSMSDRVVSLLNATEDDLAGAIVRRTRFIAGRGPVNVRSGKSADRLRALLADVRRIRSAAIGEALTLWDRELTDIAVAEPAFAVAAIKNAAPTLIDPLLPDRSRLVSIVKSRPFEGRTLRQWARSLERADLDRIDRAVKIGLVQGEHPRTIARRVVGTARLRGSDGVTQITRRNAEAISWTAVNAIANEARTEFARSNRDLIAWERFVATLDARTTPICMSLDGKLYPVGEGEIPPVHIKCRSLRVMVLSDEYVSERPMKPVTEKGLVREYRVQRALPESVRTRADLPRGTKGDFDKFARRRTRELTGVVPDTVTYPEFLRRQGAAFQDDVLGPTKGALFRSGGLSLDRFVDRRGNPVRLSDLVRSERAAFVRAGLDPARYGG